MLPFARRSHASCVQTYGSGIWIMHIQYPLMTYLPYAKIKEVISNDSLLRKVSSSDVYNEMILCIKDESEFRCNIFIKD